MDIATFRASLPEFADTTKYPDLMVTLWLNEAIARLSPMLWGDRLQIGLLWLTAHLLALAARGAKSGGVSQGLVSSKSLGPGSISYDNAVGTHEGAGSYNLTSYGVQFWELAQLAGMGGVQLSPYPFDVSAGTGIGVLPSDFGVLYRP